MPSFAPKILQNPRQKPLTPRPKFRKTFGSSLFTQQATSPERSLGNTAFAERLYFNSETQRTQNLPFSRQPSLQIRPQNVTTPLYLKRTPKEKNTTRPSENTPPRGLDPTIPPFKFPKMPGEIIIKGPVIRF